MFVLMSEFLSAGGIARDLMLACNRLMRGVRGGLAMTAVIAGAVLAAASGSSTASVAAIARSTFPTMKALGYQPGFAIGTISVAGTLAIMIPPSIAFVVYGIIAEESIGRLFIAGIAPGLLTAAGYIVTIWICIKLKPALAPAAVSRAAVIAGTEDSGRVWPVMLLIVTVLGALYTGVATPTEVGALGALGALAITVAMGRMDRRAFGEAVGHTLRTTTMIVTIIFGAVLFGYFMAFTQVTAGILDWIARSGLPPHLVLAMLDWEAEIAVVIGRIMRDVAAADALDFVAGYTLLNDVSAREFQFDVKPPQTRFAKSMDGFCPMGPWLVTADEIPNPGHLPLTCRVNVALMQDGNTHDMIFAIPEILSYVSRYITLEPGDVIATGTPDGVGVFRKPPVFLQPGDVVRVECPAIGVLENPVVARGNRPA